MTKYLNIEAIKQNSLHLQGNTRISTNDNDYDFTLLNKIHTVIGVRERTKKVT